jgi:hypothetical protein
MRNLILPITIAAALSQVTGCIIEDNGIPVDEAAAITATWEFRNEATQQTTGCPTGFNTVAMHNLQLDRNNNPIPGSDVIDLFDCVDGAGISDPLVPDVYQTFLEVTDDSGNNRYAQTLSAIVDVVVTDKQFDATILNDGGYFSFGWDLVGATSNKTLACADVPNLDGVQSISTAMTTGSSAIVDKFNCEDGFAVTGGLLQGSYTVSVSAFDTSGEALGTATLDGAQAIKDRNQVTALQNISIPINNL